MSTENPKVAVLSRVRLFSGSSPRELRKLASLLDIVDVDAGYVLMQEGSPGRESFIVVEGQATVTREGDAIAVVGPGEFIGEMAMLSRQERSATVVAETHMQLLVLGPQSFQELTNYPWLMRAMAARLACRLADLEARLRGGAVPSAAARTLNKL
jgi:CRP/FNR family transcriptional regulator, cyclic AMP receptor protein